MLWEWTAGTAASGKKQSKRPEQLNLLQWDTRRFPQGPGSYLATEVLKTTNVRLKAILRETISEFKD